MPDKRPHADDVNPFGQEIARWMRRREIRSTRELGARAGVSARTIDRWLAPGFRMAREPDGAVLDKVAGALRMPPDLMRRLVAQARGYETGPALTEAQSRAVMSMAGLPEEVQDDVADAVIAMVDGVRRMDSVRLQAAIDRVNSLAPLTHESLDRIADGLIPDDELASMHKRLDLDAAERLADTEGMSMDDAREAISRAMKAAGAPEAGTEPGHRGRAGSANGRAKS